MSRIAEPSPQGSEGSSTAQAQQPARSKLVQRLLEASANLPAFLNDLLTTQAVMVAGTEAAAFLLERKQTEKGEEANLHLVSHIRPDESDADTRAAAIRAFQDIVKPCVEQAKDGAIEVGTLDGGDVQYCLVTVLRNEGAVVAVSAVITRARDMERARQRLSTMQLVAGYFELFSMRRYVEQARVVSERHQHVLQYAGAVATAEGFESAAKNMCNEMATRAGASRVAIGWVRGEKIKVRALSHTEKFDKKQELVVHIQYAMEECLDQEEPVKFDPNGESSKNVTRAAADLSRLSGGNTVLSLPLRRRDEIVGIMTVEWPPAQKVDAEDEASVAVAAELLAPQLYDRWDNDHYIWTKIWHSTVHMSKLAVGPKHTGVKLLVAAAIALVLFVSLFRMEFRVRSGVVLEAVETRSVCAPYDGFIEDVFVRPGESVKAGQVIGRFKTTDLEIKLASLDAQARSKGFAADKARKEGKIAEQRIAEFDRDEAERQADLVRYYIKQASLTAPVNGVLVKGDLMDRRNTPAKQGEVLFEIARGDDKNPDRIAVEAQIQVSERDIQNVARVVHERTAKAKQDAKPRPMDGELATTSFPDTDFSFQITRIVPNGEPKEGENVFKVYAKVENPAPWMHPGLAGEARINIEKKPIVWIWTHRLIDWLKLKLWI